MPIGAKAALELVALMKDEEKSDGEGEGEGEGGGDAPKPKVPKPKAKPGSLDHYTNIGIKKRPGAAVGFSPGDGPGRHATDSSKKRPASVGLNKKPAGSDGVQRKPAAAVAIIAHPKGSEE
eukprot:8573520-Heterocapsa_arctica.AAC.1